MPRSMGHHPASQFCIYVADHYGVPELTCEQVRAIASSQLSMDALVREKVHRSFTRPVWRRCRTIPPRSQRRSGSSRALGYAERLGSILRKERPACRTGANSARLRFSGRPRRSATPAKGSSPDAHPPALFRVQSQPGRTTLSEGGFRSDPPPNRRAGHISSDWNV